MDISKNIKSIRESKKLRQLDVANNIGIEVQQYNRYEKRGDKLSLEQIKQIANALGVTVKDILFNEGSSPQEVEQSFIIRENELLKREATFHINEIAKLHDELNTFQNTIFEIIHYKFLAICKEQGWLLPVGNERVVSLEHEPLAYDILFSDLFICSLFERNIVSNKSLVQAYKEYKLRQLQK